MILKKRPSFSKTFSNRVNEACMKSVSCGENNFAGLNAKPISQSIYEWIDSSSIRSVDETDQRRSINRSISSNRLIGQSIHRWTLHLMNRAIDQSIDRPIEEFNATSTISRQINGPSIDQAIDRFIDQSISRRIDRSINQSSGHFRIHRIGRTRERKYKGERSEGTSKISKTESQKKYTSRGARAPLAPACPYTVNILRRAPAWCIFFGQKVIVTLWPGGSANDRLESFLRINAIMLLCGFSRRNQKIYATIAAVVIPLKGIRSTSQALPSDFEQTRRRIRSLLLL